MSIPPPELDADGDVFRGRVLALPLLSSEGEERRVTSLLMGGGGGFLLDSPLLSESEDVDFFGGRVVTFRGGREGGAIFPELDFGMEEMLGRGGGPISGPPSQGSSSYSSCSSSSGSSSYNSVYSGRTDIRTNKHEEWEEGYGGLQSEQLSESSYLCARHAVIAPSSARTARHITESYTLGRASKCTKGY